MKRKFVTEPPRHQQERREQPVEEVANNGSYQFPHDAVALADGAVTAPEAAPINAVSKASFSPSFNSNDLNAFMDSSGIVNNNNNVISVNNNDGSNNDLQFNLLNSVFINDLFTYETEENLVSAGAAALVAPTAAYMEVAGPSAAADEEGVNWQASDLLELDHRYNSGLQAGGVLDAGAIIATATVATEGEQVAVSDNMHQLQPSHISQEAVQLTFLAPQQQVSQSCHTQSKYRHLQQQPPSTDTDVESDLEDKNLSWLLNFKLDDFPHLSPEVGSVNASHPVEAAKSALPSAKTASAPQRSGKRRANAASMPRFERARSKSPKTAGKKFEELVMEATDEGDGSEKLAKENGDDNSSKTQKKPPFTYTELIEYALEDKGELTVSGIYLWISERFPFYKCNDDRWKNSIRHNLSINPHFRKGAKALQGAGHLWTISSGDSAENLLAWEHKKQRLELFFKLESLNRERIQEHQQKMQEEDQQLLQQSKRAKCFYDEAAAAAAVITQEMLQQSSTSSSSPQTSLMSSYSSSNSRDLRQGFQELNCFDDALADEELRRTAGQILKGVHRDVEVQPLNTTISTYQDVLEDSDYLTPLYKDEYGADNGQSINNTSHSNHNHTTQYYVGDLDPMEFGIHMSQQVEEEALLSDDFNFNYINYNASNSDIAA